MTRKNKRSKTGTLNYKVIEGKNLKYYDQIWLLYRVISSQNSFNYINFIFTEDKAICHQGIRR